MALTAIDVDSSRPSTDGAFRYDIAFSFMKEDEGLATQINDRLQDRYRTFLYSKAQEQLGGTDGEKTFNDVFGNQALSVAVLLRAGWGKTPWTRIEETAIRNRAFNEGYDFTTFIVTVPGTPIPDWLPKARIWYNIERFGLDGAAAVLEFQNSGTWRELESKRRLPTKQRVFSALETSMRKGKHSSAAMRA